MAAPLNLELSDKTKEDEHSLQIENTESKNHISHEADDVPSSDITEKEKLLPQIELDKEEGSIKTQSKNSSEHSQNSSQSDIFNKSLQNDNGVEANPVTFQNTSHSDIFNISLRNNNGSEASPDNVQNNSQSDISNKSLPNETSLVTVVEKCLANGGPAKVQPYMKFMPKGPLAEKIQEGSVVKDLNIVLSIWDDQLNISFQVKNDISLYQIDYQGNGASKKIVLCQHGKGAFSISCGEEENNLCVLIPEYPKENSEIFLKHFNYEIDNQCIQKKAELKWETSHRKITPGRHPKGANKNVFVTVLTCV
ncbi:unnamed protein product [Mytilus coruscus]|uniref:Uncharacterized protein n=1 Tax=Mytilus coruscus TaxID=42192 RepID=A0A6J8D2L6_MYTCO|nr:unnamed protein product [Mytilus coruscus]